MYLTKVYVNFRLQLYIRACSSSILLSNDCTLANRTDVSLEGDPCPELPYFTVQGLNIGE